MSTARRLQPRHMTLEEYLALPPDEVGRTELIYGEMIVSPSPADSHQDLLHNLGELLKRWSKFHGLGKMSFDLDMVLDEAKALAYRPDLLFLTTEHQHRRRRGRVFGPADLAIEILSPSKRPRSLQAKYRDYAHYGVTWYWIVNPLGDEPMLEEHELKEGDYALRSEVIGNKWFEPRLFPGLLFRLPPLIEGDLKAAVKGKAKKLV